MKKSYKKTILIIDDDGELRQMLVTLLTAEGYQAETAESGMEGVLKAVRTVPDLILCDIVMAGISGITAAKEIQKRLTDDHQKLIPIIMLTGQRLQKDVMQSVTAGAIDYVLKPFNPDMLLQKIRTYLKPSEVAKKSLKLLEARRKMK